MRPLAALLLALSLTACSSADDASSDPEASQTPCQLDAECVLEECVQAELVADCIDDPEGWEESTCDFNEMQLYQCGPRECGADNAAIGTALSMLTDAYEGMVCAD